MTIKNLLTSTINLTSKNGNINIIFCKDNLESYLLDKKSKTKLYPISQSFQVKKDSTLLLGTKPQYNLKVNCKNGAIEVRSYAGKRLDLTTKDGTIAGNNITAKNISAISTTGNIILKNMNSNDITTDNIYGNIALTLPGYQANYQSILQTLDGNIAEIERKKPKSLIKTYTSTLIAKTTEGNIDIKYLGQNKD